MRKATLYIAMTPEGHTLTETGGTGSFSAVEIPGEDRGHKELMYGIEMVIRGRKNFDKALSSGKGVPYEDKDKFVVSVAPFLPGECMRLFTECSPSSGPELKNCNIASPRPGAAPAPFFQQYQQG